MKGFWSNEEETRTLKNLLIQAAVGCGMVKAFGLEHDDSHDFWVAVDPRHVKSTEDFYAEKMRRLSVDLVASMSRPAPGCQVTVKQMAATARARAEALRAEAEQQDAIATGLEAAVAAMESGPGEAAS